MTADNGDADSPKDHREVLPSGLAEETKALEAGVEDNDNEEVARVANLVPADLQMFIGRQLRAVYDDVAKQPVPDRFLELMKQLDTKSA